MSAPAVKIVLAVLEFAAEHLPIHEISASVFEWMLGRQDTETLHAALEASSIAKVRAEKEALDTALLGPKT